MVFEEPINENQVDKFSIAHKEKMKQAEARVIL
jgi:hypothetical protein